MKVYAGAMSAGYSIKTIAERTGFTAATLRYYEEIGLLPPSVRTPAGYRVYGEDTVDRLAFIARAKQLGCSLDEIADLTIAWEGGRCGPVQDRLRTVVADKLAGAQQQIVELLTLSAELQQAASTLELHRPDGPCDDRCGCVSDAAIDSMSPQAVAIGSKPGSTEAIACTLTPQSMPGRLADWQAVLVHAVQREAVDAGVRVTFDSATPLDELVRLAAAEQDCCRFFSFAITVDTRGIALEVRAPDDALPIVHTVFGAAA
jgi:MerR family transcriptional regulator, copper efflux regulator